MRTLLILSSIFFATSSFAAFGSVQEEKEVVVSVSDALVPSSVKANTENVRAVISGMFPNGCYRYNRSDVQTDSKNNISEVKTYATVSQGMCLMVLVPFTKEVQLGTFDKGMHKVRFINGDGTYMEKQFTAE